MIAGRLALSLGAAVRLGASLLAAGLRVPRERRRARQAFKRTLIEAGLPPDAVRELSRLYPGLDWRDFAVTLEARLQR